MKKTFLYSLLLWLFFILFLPVLNTSVILAQEVEVEVEKKETTKPKIIKPVKTFRPDYRNQEISEFLKLMSNLIGKNIVTDDKVKGKITVVSPKKIPVDDALAYLTTILSVKGYGIVQEGNNILKVVVIKDAIGSSQLIIYSNTPWMDMTEEDFASSSTSKLSKKQIEDERIITQILTPFYVEAQVIDKTLKKLKTKSTNIVLHKETNALIFTGDPLEVNRLVKITNYLDVKEDEEDTTTKELVSFGTFHYYHLENLEANKVVSTLNSLSVPENFGELFELGTNKVSIEVPASTTPTSSKKNKHNKNVRNNKKNKLKYKRLSLVAHKDSNSILYVGTPKEFRQIVQLIKKLDQPKRQVLLEVLITEVSLDDGRSLGIDFNAVIDTLATVTSDPTFLNGISNLNSTILQTGAVIGPLIGALSLNSAIRDLNILSAPQVLAVENEEAEINVGQNIAIPRTTISGSSGITSNDFTFEEAGVKLKFTPRINKNNVVSLDIYQEIKTVIGSIQDISALNPPNFATRDLRTKVQVADNQTIVIGGLISNEVTESISKIPFLGDIPVLGYLFKRRSQNIIKRNLLIFITPHVITSREKADKITEELRHFYKERSQSIEIEKD